MRSKGTSRVSRRSLGTKKRRGPSKWLISVTTGYDDAGKQQRHYETFRGSAADAEVRISEIAEHYEHSPQASRRLTFQQFSEKKYLPNVQRHRRRRTVEGYCAKLTLHIFPSLGDRPLDSLRPYDFDELLDELEDAGMSAANRVHVRRVAMQVMNYAAEKGYIGPWASKRVNRPEAVPPPKNSLTQDEARAYLNAFVDHEVELAVALGLCAMRPCEICGVQHPDVDLAARTLHIRRGVHRVAGGFVVEDPKTPESDREIALTARAVEAFRRHPGVSGYILQRPDGRPMTVDMVWRRYKKHVEECGLRYVTWKYLRHTTGSLALKHQGRKRVDTRAVADYYGHTEEQTFETFYNDRSGVVGRDVADVLDDVYGS